MATRLKEAVRRRWLRARHPELRDPSLALHPPGEFISDQISKHRTYYEVAALVRVAQQFDTSRYVDIGANIGNHCHYFARLGGAGWAFEPALSNFSLLRQNAPGFNCYQVALSDHDGTIELATFSSCMGNSHVIEVFGSPQDAWGTGMETEVVPLRRLDDYALDRPTFVKIDVEGSELAVLRGSRQTLAAFKPALWIELHTDETLRRARFPYKRDDVVDELHAHGYSLMLSLDETNHVFAAT